MHCIISFFRRSQIIVMLGMVHDDSLPLVVGVIALFEMTAEPASQLLVLLIRRTDEIFEFFVSYNLIVLISKINMPTRCVDEKII